MQRLKADRQAGKRAIIIAVHHPLLSVDAKTGGSGGLMKDIDSCCQKAGLWPDVLLSGHAHLYQRFTRTVNGRQVPYIVAGSGGFAATAPQQAAPPAGTVVGDHKLEINPIIKFGYLTLTTDAKTLTIAFKTAPRAPCDPTGFRYAGPSARKHCGQRRWRATKCSDHAHKASSKRTSPTCEIPRNEALSVKERMHKGSKFP